MSDFGSLLGVALSIGGAFALACSYLCIRVGTDRGMATDAVLLIMAVNLVVLTPLVAVFYYPTYGVTLDSLAVFAAAGVFGTLLGRICAYTSIGRIGASRTSPLLAARAFVATILGIVLLNEALTALQGAGIVAIVVGTSGLVWETAHENPDDLPRSELVRSLGIAAVAAVAFGVEPILANWGFQEGTPAPVGVVIKTVAATGGMVAYLRWRGELPAPSDARSSETRWFVLAGLCNTLFILAYYVALALAPVSLVVPLVVTNPLFVVALGAVFMPDYLERVTPRLIVAAVVVVGGVVAVTVA
ncbi:MAG: EamA family transporter [Haloferacaceae archaeon]